VAKGKNAQPARSPLYFNALLFFSFNKTFTLVANNLAALAQGTAAAPMYNGGGSGGGGEARPGRGGGGECALDFFSI
jgi:hypothetical protein